MGKEGRASVIAGSKHLREVRAANKSLTARQEAFRKHALALMHNAWVRKRKAVKPVLSSDPGTVGGVSLG